MDRLRQISTKDSDHRAQGTNTTAGSSERGLPGTAADQEGQGQKIRRKSAPPFHLSNPLCHPMSPTAQSSSSWQLKSSSNADDGSLGLPLQLLPEQPRCPIRAGPPESDCQTAEANLEATFPATVLRDHSAALVVLLHQSHLLASMPCSWHVSFLCTRHSASQGLAQQL